MLLRSRAAAVRLQRYMSSRQHTQQGRPMIVPKRHACARVAWHTTTARPHHWRAAPGTAAHARMALARGGRICTTLTKPSGTSSPDCRQACRASSTAAMSCGQRSRVERRPLQRAVPRAGVAAGPGREAACRLHASRACCAAGAAGRAACCAELRCVLSARGARPPAGSGRRTAARGSPWQRRRGSASPRGG